MQIENSRKSRSPYIPRAIASHQTSNPNHEIHLPPETPSTHTELNHVQAINNDISFED